MPFCLVLFVIEVWRIAEFGRGELITRIGAEPLFAPVACITVLVCSRACRLGVFVSRDRVTARDWFRTWTWSPSQVKKVDCTWYEGVFNRFNGGEGPVVYFALVFVIQGRGGSTLRVIKSTMASERVCDNQILEFERLLR